MKLWAKTVVEDKITRDVVFEYSSTENEDEFIAVLQDVCGLLDIPTPVATSVNFHHFVMFNNTRFKERDFVESIDFDVLDLEAVPEREKQKN
ncbi:MAG: hypothetical protein NC132_01040 [Corallococcus sp.]|nr:hypothetical protein [Corallococcus sp.]MCM1359495.1 hypothetical protein [Corallococcus sp.]MCM1394693.1 hypothetical protein [Corallococcus sp.]